jgi:anti-sigma-K factor RskA
MPKEVPWICSRPPTPSALTLEGKVGLYFSSAPPLPADTTSQLWAILDKPISTGTVAADSGNNTRLLIRRVPEPSEVKECAVSVEPEGGHPQPTGPISL